MQAEGLLTVDHPEDGVAWVEIRWPDPGHVYSAAVLATMAARLRAVAADGPAAIVLASRGSGCDPDHTTCELPSALDWPPWFRTGAMTLLTAVGDMRPVSVAALDGDVSSVELLVALACDVRAAADTATLHTRAGVLVPGVASLVRRICGRAGLAAAIADGAGWTADQALSRRLVSRVYPVDVMRAEALGLAKDIASRKDRMPQIAKRMMQLPDDLDTAEALEYELNLIVGTEPR